MPNQLQFERSPYLLQHAENPVNWFAWGEAAFAEARAQNKPVLVSIGYSTCHWCHVMERESFEDIDTAAFMNKHFINIKIDREERPDLDQIYMEACQLITGGGGWPLNCFLLPDARPFFAGTYFPPKPAYGRPSWVQVLQNISNAFAKQPEIITKQAEKLTELIGKSDKKYFKSEEKFDVSIENPFDATALDNMAKEILERADRENGGFGRAPKFPHAMTIQYLLHYHQSAEKSPLRDDALQQACFALDSMILGGIYDQIGGGFARYTVDNEWIVPHFEKMLYDNALLISTLSTAYKITQKPLYRQTIIETVNFVLWEMLSPRFGFYSAFDADSEGEEGKYYVWTKAEMTDLLGAAATLFCDFYGVTEQGNFEGSNILFRQKELKTFCEERNLDETAVKETFDYCQSILLDTRDERVPPSMDDKILTAWNALMITALAQAHEALGGEADDLIREELKKPLKIHNFKDMAMLNIEYLLHELCPKNQLFHAAKDSEAYGEAFLEDYAFVIEALLAVYEISFQEKYLMEAKRLTDEAIHQFFDAQDGLFFFTKATQQDVVVRKKDIFDNATPAANSTMLQNLQRLAILFDEKSYAEKAENMLKSMSETLKKYPVSFSRWALGAVWQSLGAQEIAITGKKAATFAEQINGHFVSNKILMTQVTNYKSTFPLLENRFLEGKDLIYICKNFACQRPVENVIAALELLKIIKN